MHTPGPWWVNIDCPTQIDCNDSNNKHLADAARYFRPERETLANARLIAAAPAMADAIRQATRAAEVVQLGNNAGKVLIPRGLFDELEDALDTATGEFSHTEDTQ